MQRPRPNRTVHLGKRHGRTKRFAIVLCILAVSGIYSASTLLWPLQTLRAEAAAPAAVPATEVTIDWPAYGQSAVYAPDYGLLGSAGSGEPIPIASITKIVTALTVLDDKPIAAGSSGETITFTTDDVARYNAYLAQLGTVAPVTPGRTISELDMFNIMLVASANNYADSLAIWAFGSMEAYLAAANQYLAAHGLHDTHVADASGFSPDSRSTAMDLVRLGELALAQPVIAAAVDTERLTIQGVGTFHNTNLLLHQDDAVSGIKTGTTDEAGSCLLYAKRFTVGTQSVRIIGATLGAPTHPRLATDAANVLASASSGFAETTLATPEQAFATYQTPWGETAQAVTGSAVTGLVWRGNELTPSVTTEDIKHDDASERIGSVTFKQGEHVVATADLKLDRQPAGPSWWWRLSHPQHVFAD